MPNIHRPRVAHHKPRTTAPAFDPSRVSRTLSPRAHSERVVASYFGNYAR